MADARCRAEVCSRSGAPSSGCSPSGHRPHQRSLRSAEMRSRTGWRPGRTAILSPTRGNYALIAAAYMDGGEQAVSALNLDLPRDAQRPDTVF